MAREKMTETVTIRLSKGMKAALQALADADSRKLASYLTLVLQRHLEKADKPKGRK
jgi:predicted DNA-binding protein